MKKLAYLLFIFLLFTTTACSLPSTAVAADVEQKEPETGSENVQIVVETADSALVGTTATGEVGYLFAPIGSTTTYLMNTSGEALQTWESNYRPGHSVYLRENGNLLHTGSVRSSTFGAGGAGGIIEEIAPDGTIVWSFQYADEQVQQHHDIEELPNGNILMIAWERKSQAEALAAGRSSSLLNDGELWPDHIIEVDPSTNQIVWEWHVWDHLIQDSDATKPNFGVVAEHPERIDLNYTPRQAGADWNHINAIDYNAELDQILLSVHGFSEFWIIDHSTTTAEAAGEVGDLLYRWGNPQTYDSGSAAEQQLYVQHDAQWIPAGHPGAGNILVFNNGDRRERPYSSVDEVVVPLNTDGSYTLENAPQSALWTYSADNFYADHISGAQRLANGNTLICSGTDGRFFEVTPAGEIIWEYDYGESVFRVTRYEAGYTGMPDSTATVAIPQSNTADQPPASAEENTSQQGQGTRLRLDLASAASTLGVSQEALRAALGEPGQGKRDFAAAAAQLGVTEQILTDALGIPAGGPPQE